MWSIIEKYWSDCPENRGSAEDIIYSLYWLGTVPTKSSFLPSFRTIFDCEYSDSEGIESGDSIYPINTQKELSVRRESVRRR